MFQPLGKNRWFYEGPGWIVSLVTEKSRSILCNFLFAENIINLLMKHHLPEKVLL